MRKKEFYLDYKVKRKKTVYNKNSRNKRVGKGTAAFAIFCAALVLGIGAYFFSKQAMDKEKEEEMGDNTVLGMQMNELTKQTEYGPYGMWISKPVEEEILQPVEEKEVWMSDFIDNREPIVAKGIYVTASKANGDMNNLIELVASSEINAMVIDIKDDDGNITYKMDYKEAIDYNATKAYISDIDGVISKLKKKDIYLIARVVTFKDPVLANARPDLALKNKDGTTFRDKDKQAWVNPYKKEVWDYLVGVGSACAKLGFDEVNFDYIRFSTDSGMAHVDFGEEAIDKTKIETVSEFVKYACEQLKPQGIFVSADVYGAIINSSVDAKIVGQSYAEMSKYLDYICPMIYPSHYGDGYYGIKYPDTEPYRLIKGALESSKKSLDQIPEGEHRAIVRPWLQDFTASWLRHYIRYGAKEVREQIEAVYDTGYNEWILWNGAMNYTTGALYTEEEANFIYENRPTPTPLPTPTNEPLPTRVPNAGEYYESPWKAGD